jgi:hypothetical protein
MIVGELTVEACPCSGVQRISPPSTTKDKGATGEAINSGACHVRWRSQALRRYSVIAPSSPAELSL